MYGNKGKAQEKQRNRMDEITKVTQQDRKNYIKTNSNGIFYSLIIKCRIIKYNFWLFHYPNRFGYTKCK